MKTTLFCFSILFWLSACQSGNNPPEEASRPVGTFSISKDALVTATNGIKKKLADVLVWDSTIVVRVTSKHPAESRHIPLSRLSWFTDEYPATDSIIILTDSFPAKISSGWNLNYAYHKVSIFQIDDSLLPTAMESRQRAYLFYLNRQLQASRVYMPDSLTGEKTVNYFAGLAATMKRKETNPLIAHTKRMNRYRGTIGSSGATTSLRLSDRRVTVGQRTVSTEYYEDFYFRNTGREPLVIEKVNKNWNCSGCRVYVPEHAVNPGERERIRVYYTPSRTGTFRYSATVYSNTTGSPHTLIITGTAASASRGSKYIRGSRYKRY